MDNCGPFLKWLSMDFQLTTYVSTSSCLSSNWMTQSNSSIRPLALIQAMHIGKIQTSIDLYSFGRIKRLYVRIFVVMDTYCFKYHETQLLRNWQNFVYLTCSRHQSLQIFEFQFSKSLFLFIEGGQENIFYWSKIFFGPMKNVFLSPFNK